MVRQAHHDRKSLTLADRWILSRLQGAARGVTKALEEYRFNEMARLLHQFLWGDFCDWYLEIAKLQREEPALKPATERVLRLVLERVLRLLHPVMPFITEELWQKVSGRGSSILLESWPQPQSEWEDPKAESEFARLQAVIAEVRNIRATFRVPVKEKVGLLIQGSRGTEWLGPHEKTLQRLGSVGQVTARMQGRRPAGSVVSHLPAGGGFVPWDLIVPLEGLVDLEKERRRIETEVEALQQRARSKRQRLQDSDFRRNAPAEVVAQEEGSLKELEQELAKWAESLKQLEAG